MWRVLFGVVWLGWRAAIAALEGMFWALALTRDAFSIGRDALKARQTLRAGVLYCPRGHAIIETGPFQCLACGFVADDAAFVCPNPECGASTVYLNCPTCGRSVRSPFRWGRPHGSAHHPKPVVRR